MSRELKGYEKDAALYLCMAHGHFAPLGVGSCASCKAAIAHQIDTPALPSPGVGEREKDSERLDWMQQNPHFALTIRDNGTATIFTNTADYDGDSLRAALDAARSDAETLGEGE